jgi:hypothetical protein
LQLRGLPRFGKKTAFRGGFFMSGYLLCISQAARASNF